MGGEKMDDVDDDLRFADDHAGSRYTLHRGGHLVSVLDYRDDGRTIRLVRAFTDQAFRGEGFAGIVTERAVADLAARGDRVVVPVCPYVVDWLAAHPEQAGTLPASSA